MSDTVQCFLEVELISYTVPGESYSLPIEAVTQNKVRIQPDRAQLNPSIDVLHAYIVL